MYFNRKQFQTKNFKGVLSLLAGNTISKVVATIGGIILANYYGPDGYGIYNVFLSYMLILPILAGLRLDSIMIMQRESREMRNLFSGTLAISFVLTLALVTLLIGIKLLNIINLQLPYFIIFLCGLGAVLTAWNQTQYNLFTKYKFFKQISTALVVFSVVSVISQAIFYFLNREENGLIYGCIVGLFASFVYNSFVSKESLQKLDIPLFKSSVRDHINIIKYTYPSDSLNAIANNVLPILVLVYFSQSQVGVYAMAFKILSTPLVLLSGSVSSVYFQKAVSLHLSDKKSLMNLTNKVILSNVAIILIFIVLMNTGGMYLLNLFLGKAWNELGNYVLALSFWILARSAMNPIAPLVVVINKNHYSLIFNIYLLIVNILSLYLGVQINNFLYCIWIFSILSGIGYLFLLGSILISLRKNVTV